MDMVDVEVIEKLADGLRVGIWDGYGSCSTPELSIHCALEWLSSLMRSLAPYGDDDGIKL